MVPCESPTKAQKDLIAVDHFLAYSDDSNPAAPSSPPHGSASHTSHSSLFQSLWVTEGEESGKERREENEKGGEGDISMLAGVEPEPKRRRKEKQMTLLDILAKIPQPLEGRRATDA